MFKQSKCICWKYNTIFTCSYGTASNYVKCVCLGKNKEIVKNINEWKIELHELFPCINKEELFRKEGEVIREIGTLNRNIAGRIDKEYRIDNKEELKEYYKQYFTDHKEEIKEQRKQYLINHKVEIKQYNKQYLINNKEEIKQYFTDHKDKINEKRRQLYLKKKLPKSQTITT